MWKNINYFNDFLFKAILRKRLHGGRPQQLAAVRMIGLHVRAARVTTVSPQRQTRASLFRVIVRSSFLTMAASTLPMQELSRRCMMKASSAQRSMLVN